jgi:hypothetical protein
VYAILIYREHDADTSVNGPYETVEAATKARDKLARDIADRRPAKQVVAPFDYENATVIVYNADYKETEPTDDDWHVLLTIEPMGAPIEVGS